MTMTLSTITCVHLRYIAGQEGTSGTSGVTAAGFAGSAQERKLTSADQPKVSPPVESC